LNRKIAATPANRLIVERIRVSNPRKLLILVRALTGRNVTSATAVRGELND